MWTWRKCSQPVRMHGNTGVVTGAYQARGTRRKTLRVSRPAHRCLDENRGRWQVIASHYSACEVAAISDLGQGKSSSAPPSDSTTQYIPVG